MIDPLFALLGFGGLVVVAALLFWPGRGLVPLLGRWSRAGARVSMEDALKHLYKVERRGGEASIASVAGALGTGQHAAGRVLEQLREAGLVAADRPLQLTAEGRSYALRIIRTHRLWERYLADRTGVEPRDWHAAAEEREHHLSDDEVEDLAARLGHPRYDPHGDPIPTASGEIPEPAGLPLSRLSAGERGLVIHLEDEPAAFYERLVALGLSPNLALRVVDRDGGRLLVEADGRTFELDPVVAENVTVERLAEGEGETAPPDEAVGAETLADLPLGEVAEVVGLAPSCQGIQRRRLLDLGVVPGTRISAELASFGNGPVAYLVRGALIALRTKQQRWVRIRRVDEEEAA
jgi:DtxR family transcriptional regulator, Mn-dependent transcriptional regulator